MDSLQVQVSVLEEKVARMCTRSMHKRERREAAKLSRQEKEINELKEKMDTLSTKNTVLTSNRG